MPKRSRTTLLLYVALLLQLSPTPSISSTLADEKSNSYVAIIIDDIGHHHRRGKQAIDLPAALTYSVIPDTKHSIKLARYAHLAGKEVMIHLPMANTRGQAMSRIALTQDMGHMEYPTMVKRALTRVPFAKGLNNHMGSQLTQEPQAMSWLMDTVKHHGMFFVDSRTTPKTVAKDIASRKNVLSASRDVFLDNERTLYSIDKQFRRLIRLAKRRETAIAIGHPYPETISYLALALPLLEAENIRVVSVSEMIGMRLAEKQLATSDSSSGR